MAVPSGVSLSASNGARRAVLAEKANGRVGCDGGPQPNNPVPSARVDGAARGGRAGTPKAPLTPRAQNRAVCGYISEIRACAQFKYWTSYDAALYKSLDEFNILVCHH